MAKINVSCSSSGFSSAWHSSGQSDQSCPVAQDLYNMQTFFFSVSLSCSFGRHTSYEQSLALPTNDDDDMLFTMLTSALF